MDEIAQCFCLVGEQQFVMQRHPSSCSLEAWYLGDRRMLGNKPVSRVWIPFAIYSLCALESVFVGLSLIFTLCRLGRGEIMSLSW